MAGFKAATGMTLCDAASIGQGARPAPGPARGAGNWKVWRKKTVPAVYQTNGTFMTLSALALASLYIMSRASGVGAEAAVSPVGRDTPSQDERWGDRGR